MGAAKVVDDVLNHTMRKHDPKNEHLNVAKRWKRAAGFIALRTYSIAWDTIYFCADDMSKSDRSGSCHWHLRLPTTRGLSSGHGALLEIGSMGRPLRMDLVALLVRLPLHDRLRPLSCGRSARISNCK